MTSNDAPPAFVTVPARAQRPRPIIERDQQVISPSYTRSYPLVAERGEGAMVEDPDGNRFLDFAAGIAVVATGHCHPEVVKAIQEQAAQADSYVRHRFLLRKYGPAGREASTSGAGGRSAEGFTSETRERRRSRRPSSWPAITPARSNSSLSWAPFTAGPWDRWR